MIKSNAKEDNHISTVTKDSDDTDENDNDNVKDNDSVNGIDIDHDIHKCGEK